MTPAKDKSLVVMDLPPLGDGADLVACIIEPTATHKDRLDRSPYLSMPHCRPGQSRSARERERPGHGKIQMMRSHREYDHSTDRSAGTYTSVLVIVASG